MKILFFILMVEKRIFVDLIIIYVYYIRYFKITYERKFMSLSVNKIRAKHIAFAAMAVALAIVTSMIKIIKLPMGGSVTLFSMLFIVLIGYWYGIKAGLTAALAYGVLQLLLDPYILNIPQVLLDYILGFGALGLSGIFSNSKHGLIKGYIVGVIGRFICSFLSGWIFFAVYTPEFFNSAILYSIVYNGSYIGLEAAVTLVVISLPPVNKALAYVKNNLVYKMCI